MSYQPIQRGIEDEWDQLASHYLPDKTSGSIWRYGKGVIADGLDQGWKIHISATILNATDVLKAIAPLLDKQQIPFKAPVSINELMKINAGIYYGYSQVGKFITIYPPEQNEILELATELYRLTLPFSSPKVPFDNSFMPNGSVFYRYGAFRNRFFDDSDGQRVASILSASGKPVPDLRTNPNELPNGISNPFHSFSQSTDRPNTLNSKFKIFEALAQRGKGGVYKAFEFRNKSPKLCIVKEGRMNGEVQWDGQDGASRVRHEGIVLRDLHSQGIRVPSVLDDFEVAGNFYLVTELIRGQTLNSILRNKRTIHAEELLDLTGQLAHLLSTIHHTGWVWRDCKPTNIILSLDKSLRPIDFEGACRIGEIDPLPWSTPAYSPPEVLNGEATKALPNQDLFALGSVISGVLDCSDISKSLRSKVKKIADELRNSEADSRPAAEQIALRLDGIKAAIQKKHPR